MGIQQIFNLNEVEYKMRVISLAVIFMIMVSASLACHPQCGWKCDDPKCDAVCSPVCEPPKCHSSC